MFGSGLRHKKAQAAIEYSSAVAFYMLICIALATSLSDEQKRFSEKVKLDEKEIYAARISEAIDYTLLFKGLESEITLEKDASWNMTIGVAGSYIAKSYSNSTYASVHKGKKALVKNGRVIPYD